MIPKNLAQHGFNTFNLWIQLDPTPAQLGEAMLLGELEEYVVFFQTIQVLVYNYDMYVPRKEDLEHVMEALEYDLGSGNYQQGSIAWVNASHIPTNV